MNKIFALVIALLLAGGASKALSHAGMDMGTMRGGPGDSMKTEKKKEGKVAVSKGDPETYEVVDVACYVTKGAKGTEHKECAAKCIHGGGELALLDEKGDLFFPLDENFHSIRGVFSPSAGEKISVVGKVFRTKGINYLIVFDVK